MKYILSLTLAALLVLAVTPSRSNAQWPGRSLPDRTRSLSNISRPLSDISRPLPNITRSLQDIRGGTYITTLPVYNSFYFIPSYGYYSGYTPAYSSTLGYTPGDSTYYYAPPTETYVGPNTRTSFYYTPTFNAVQSRGYTSPYGYVNPPTYYYPR